MDDFVVFLSQQESWHTIIKHSVYSFNQAAPDQSTAMFLYQLFSTNWQHSVPKASKVFDKTLNSKADSSIGCKNMAQYIKLRENHTVLP